TSSTGRVRHIKPAFAVLSNRTVFVKLLVLLIHDRGCHILQPCQCQASFTGRGHQLIDGIIPFLFVLHSIAFTLCRLILFFRLQKLLELLGGHFTDRFLYCCHLSNFLSSSINYCSIFSSCFILALISDTAT